MAHRDSETMGERNCKIITLTKIKSCRRSSITSTGIPTSPRSPKTTSRDTTRTRTTITTSWTRTTRTRFVVSYRSIFNQIFYLNLNSNFSFPNKITTISRTTKTKTSFNREKIQITENNDLED